MTHDIDKSPTVLYEGQELKIDATPQFRAWFENLRDRRARQRIVDRLDRMAMGNFGDVKSVGEGVQELRIHYGAGYRIYFTRRGNVLVILLNGGDKASQSRDIAAAKELKAEVERFYGDQAL